MNSSIFHDKRCSLIHKWCHPRSFHSDIKYLMTLNIILSAETKPCFETGVSKTHVASPSRNPKEKRPRFFFLSLFFFFFLFSINCQTKLNHEQPSKFGIIQKDDDQQITSTQAKSKLQTSIPHSLKVEAESMLVGTCMHACMHCSSGGTPTSMK